MTSPRVMSPMARLVFPRPDSLSASIASVREASQAGTRPDARAASMVAATTNASTGASIVKAI